MAANMYRVGDYVYFENSSSNPYLIRRIEELNKTANGNVEAKVVCLFRRRDISGNLNTLADSNAREFEEESKQPTLSEQQKHQLKHRELFLSRQFESLPATHIRGKCNVTLLNETDVLAGYLDKEDCFFYSLVFDPVQKTLLADQGEIRVGSKYQAEIPDKLAEGESDNRVQEKLETKVWDPNNQLKDPQIDQFLVVARAVGTFARALDCSSSIRQPSLHMSAAAASRDITLAANPEHETAGTAGFQKGDSARLEQSLPTYTSQAAGVPYPANGRPYTSGMRTTSQSVIKRQKVSQGEAPNPVVFVATKDTRALRKHLTQSEMRRAARKPHLLVRIKLPPPPRSLAMPLLPSSTSEPIVLED
ncbi:metastasis-associated protein MTA2 [Morone saxatilis]|uniref:metastasis-associated protein MTA2 n=1 Tax=Morone saxatilis TaxID=34816 RepID=UPI0015E20155|nr:metastasis-associated protein MTA2 [Morone saxatilis]